MISWPAYRWEAEYLSLFAGHGGAIPGIMAGVFISVAGKGAVMIAQGGLTEWAERSALRRAGCELPRLAAEDVRLALYLVRGEAALPPIAVAFGCTKPWRGWPAHQLAQVGLGPGV